MNANEQTAPHMLANSNIHLGDRGVSSVSDLMAKIVGPFNWGGGRGQKKMWFIVCQVWKC